ncbi:sulfate/molybdate ABC transporter ATP-binding protein [Thermoleptolyngbya sp. C42_A2020_037]|uniref:sulfate/molybdate ABC transporter ATP-binding protein n=1 Tax=Thermoleptolyngbya sp. C42_A2020_037 TaxID=2747799 RepID=UPI0019E9A00E|nr:sulfate/molybdate ABC transporter ATP-binding protein [Thermoleptolyngbya sp. C42_A2020_037]MBF2084356.1 sulfate/molybdate ABC transporter ATP-binding protein [Thermoleptolyngbya sp. C42_A2020_037]
MSLLVDIQKRLPSYTLNVAFSAEREPLGILGGSGSGKSMTLRCIAGIETPTSGTIVLNNRILYDSRKGINLPSRDRRVGFLFQNYALFPHLTVAQNIAYGLNKRQGSKQEKRELVQTVEAQLGRVQLAGFGNRYPHQLSGGQQQRVALARALAPNPDILLLDEPFSALDTHLRSELEKQLIKTLADYNGITLFVSHNLEEAYRVCQRLLVLSSGTVIANGYKQDVFHHPKTMPVAQLTGCKNYTRIQPINQQTVRAPDWNCTLHTDEPVSSKHTHIGIRAHHIRFSHPPHPPNTFPAWLAWTSETPHRMTLFLKLGNAPRYAEDYHLQAEVFKEEWERLKDRPQPWHLTLDPLRLLLLE